MEQQKISKETAKAISAGSSFSGSILLGYFGGDWVGSHLGWGDWGVIGGTLLGFVVGNWLVFRILLSSKK